MPADEASPSDRSNWLTGVELVTAPALPARIRDLQRAAAVKRRHHLRRFERLHVLVLGPLRVAARRLRPVLDLGLRVLGIVITG